ncbi:GNAT family N-acetyltransferase [Xylophilus sp.]|uniref:GNAT family N-acetyltransferase n=1 Tax=Xylophilus sp. TaxID=2653893 RepID=UPI0013B60ACE|nr:GNAT family N-acetyltransferase [Xylophilus sp.]KAF1041780.1 MAG: hypothetical protein GAK38_04503 [Xylophilus sp.]
MIEHATLADVPELVSLGRLMVAESPRWRRLEYSADRVGRTITALIESSSGAVFVARQEGQIIGTILLVAEPNWMSDEVICQEMAFFMHPDHRGAFAASRLIRTAIAWSEIKKARWIEAGSSTGVNAERTAQLYERLGFTRFQIGLECEHGT